jgi:hypothetical protein
MNTMGKILTILILLCAVFVGGLISIVWATSERFNLAYEELKQELTAARASSEVAEQTKKNALAERQKAVEAAEELEKKLTRQKEAYDKELKDARDYHKTLNTTSDAHGLVQKITTEENARLQKENQGLQEANAKYEKANVTLRDSLRQKDDDLRIAKGETDAAKSRSEQLLDRNRELEKWKATATVTAGSSPGGAAVKDPSAPNPPPRYVRGVVEKIDPSGLVEISVGSDAGLAKDQTLDAYRLRPDAKYLGMIRIVEADLHKSIARVVSSRPGTRVELRPGDEVASSIQPPR